MNEHFSSAFHSLNRVQKNVEKQLLELRLVGINRRQVIVADDGYGDFRLLHSTSKKRQGLLKHWLDTYRRSSRDWRSESTQPCYELINPFDLADDNL